MTEMTDFEVDHEISHLGLREGNGYYDDGDWVDPVPAEIAENRRRVYRAGMAKGVELWLRLQSSSYPPNYLTGDPT